MCLGVAILNTCHRFVILCVLVFGVLFGVQPSYWFKAIFWWERMSNITMDLAASWENQLAIRNRSRETGALTAWPSVDQTGCPSVKAMVLNLPALESMASWWVSKSNEPKPIPIQDIREQAICSSKLLVVEICIARRFYHRVTFISIIYGSNYVV